MDNINLNTVSRWTVSDAEKPSVNELTIPIDEAKSKPDISNDIVLFEKLLNRIETKQQHYPHKNLYDAICTLEISITSLKNFKDEQY